MFSGTYEVGHRLSSEAYYHISFSHKGHSHTNLTQDAQILENMMVRLWNLFWVFFPGVIVAGAWL